MVEGPRRSLCSDNRAPDGKELEGENRIRIRFSPPSFLHSGTRLSLHKNILFLFLKGDCRAVCSHLLFPRLVPTSLFPPLVPTSCLMCCVVVFRLVVCFVVVVFLFDVLFIRVAFICLFVVCFVLCVRVMFYLCFHALCLLVLCLVCRVFKVSCCLCFS